MSRPHLELKSHPAASRKRSLPVPRPSARTTQPRRVTIDRDPAWNIIPFPIERVRGRREVPLAARLVSVAVAAMLVCTIILLAYSGAL